MGSDHTPVFATVASLLPVLAPSSSRSQCGAHEVLTVATSTVAGCPFSLWCSTAWCWHARRVGYAWLGRLYIWWSGCTTKFS